MTTADFIAKTYNTTNDKYGRYGYERRLSSVMTDKTGIVYSYGYHYPLAFNINGVDFINTSGYSSTTNKHISWAWRAIGYHAHGVKLWREDAQVIASSASDDIKIQAIIRALKRERDSLMEEMQSKKRKDTMVYASLETQLDKVMTAYHAARAAQ